MLTLLSRFRAGRADQSGGILPFVAIMSTVLIVVAALAVDLGMQRVGRRDMQALADVVALDMARHLDGKKNVGDLDLSNANSLWNRALDESVDRNDSTLGEAPVVTAEVGAVDATTGDFSVYNGLGQVPTAVRVRASTVIDFRFFGDEGAVGRVALAAVDTDVPVDPEFGARACFSVGSFAAAIKSGEGSFLGPLLGQIDTDLNLSAVSYQGLANANVSLADLAAELGAGTVDELLALNNISLSQLAIASARVLSRDGNIAAAQILTALSAQLSGMTSIDVAGPPGSTSSLLSLAQGNGSSALEGDLNVLDLLSTGAFLSNGTNVLSVPNLSAGVPGITGVTTSSLSVIERPRIACGFTGPTPASATTSQVHADIDGSLVDVNVLGTLTASTRVQTDVRLAHATGTLVKASCDETDEMDVRVSSGLASVSLNAPITITGNVSILGLGLVRLNLTTSVNTSTQAAQPGTDAAFDFPPDEVGSVRTTGSDARLPSFGNVNLTYSGTATVLGIPLLGGLTNALLQPTLTALTTALNATLIQGVLNPVVGQLNTNVLKPLQDLFGVQIAGADVYVVRAPVCDIPILVG